ncbi:MAG: class I SAM-dependent methyltransferase [Sulfitobacter sp.]
MPNLSYEDEQFIEDLDGIKKRYFEMARKCEIYEAALQAHDGWAVPETDGVDGSFQYIPYDLSGFAAVLIKLADLLPDDPDFRHSRQPIRPLSFCEVGCGIGRNLNIVKNQEILPVAKAVGFDIVPEYIETAQRLYDLGEDVFVHDAMAFDYGGFDLVFFYRPFSDDKLEAKFENHLIDSVKSGAVIIGMNTERMDKSRKVRMLEDFSDCYKKL